MKKITMLGLTLIFILAIVACSANNNTSNNAEGASNVVEDEHTEDHVTDPAEVTEPNADEPKTEEEIVEPIVEAEPAVTEPAVTEPAVVEPKEPTVVEPKEPEVVEPTPVVAAPKTHKVDIVNFAFSPESLEISVGDIVEFTNLDKVKHSAVDDNGVFDTGLLAQNESKQITFNEAGEFGYYCGPHPDMRAKIIVK